MKVVFRKKTIIAAAGRGDDDDDIDVVWGDGFQPQCGDVPPATGNDPTTAFLVAADPTSI